MTLTMAYEAAARRARPTFTLEEDETIRRMAAEGCSTRPIAEALGRSYHSVRAHAKVLGVEVRADWPGRAGRPSDLLPRCRRCAILLSAAEESDIMALCRWLDYRCDLYIYESALGIECHVAARRYENEPEPPPFPVGEDEAEWAAFWEAWAVYAGAVDASHLIPIDGPHDGEFRVFSTWSDLFVHVLDLKAAGYQVPDWVLGEIAEEVKEAVASED